MVMPICIRCWPSGLLGGHVAPTPWEEPSRAVITKVGAEGPRREGGYQSCEFRFPHSSISFDDRHNIVCLQVKIPISSFIKYTMYVGTQVSYCNT